MIPVENLAEFILYVAPGFIAVEIYRAHFPAKERNTFSEIAQSVIWALVILLAIRFIDEHWLKNWLHSNGDGVPEDRFSIALLIGGVVFGYLGVFQLRFRGLLSSRFDRIEWISSSPDSIWLKLNASNVKDWVVVYIDDGSSYLGWIKEYQYDPDSKHQDFLLTHAKLVDDNLNEIYLVDGMGVYLNTKNVKRIEFVQGRE